MLKIVMWSRRYHQFICQESMAQKADRYILAVLQLKCLEFGSFVSKSYDWFITCSSIAYRSFPDLIVSQALHLITLILQSIVQSCWTSFISSLLPQPPSLLRIYFCPLLLPLIFWPLFCLINLVKLHISSYMPSLPGNLY